MTEWIKCSERLPEKEGNYLVCDRGRDVFEAVFFKNEYYGKEIILWLDPVEEYQEYQHITHWQYLPDAPEVEG